MQRFPMSIVTLLTLGCCSGLVRASDEISYPDQFREWAQVKSALILPGHPGFESEGGIHHIYANAVARDGYRSGVFRDGAIIVYELLETSESGHVITEGARRRVDVMVHDGTRYRSTGGWGFQRFRGEDREHGILDDNGATTCFACHQRQASRGYVFSSFRP